MAILPGAGGSIASLVSYSEARRASREPETFGKGNPQGILATEAANNATVGGGFIPTLVLGIPGTPPDAVILGALMVQGFRTGPELFTTNASITYTFVAGLFLATCLLLPLGLLIGRYAFKSIITIPKALLVPTIAFMTVIGTYAIRNSVSDVIIMLTLGVVGWLLNRYGFRPSPIVLGLILGPIAEQGFVQGFLMGRASGSYATTFFGGPISITIIALSVLSVVYPLIKERRDRHRAHHGGASPRRLPHDDNEPTDPGRLFGPVRVPDAPAVRRLERGMYLAGPGHESAGGRVPDHHRGTDAARRPDADRTAGAARCSAQ